MNISTLKYFVTLAETLNFTKAARQHYIAQTTMSRQLAGLENELGVKLIERTTSSVALTDAGRIFLKDVTRILSDYERALDNINRNKHLTRTLKIGYCAHSEAEDFLNMLGDFKEKYSNIEFEITEGSLSELTADIFRGKLDAIVTFECEIEDYSMIDSFNIIDHNIVVGVNKNHPLARFDEIEPAALADYEILIIDDNISVNHRKYITECCIKDGFVPHIRKISSYNEQIIRTRFNNTVSFFPETHTVNSFKDIKFIKLRNTCHRYRINLAWHKENTDSNLYNFLVFARKYYSKL